MGIQYCCDCDVENPLEAEVCKLCGSANGLEEQCECGNTDIDTDHGQEQCRECI